MNVRRLWLVAAIAAMLPMRASADPQLEALVKAYPDKLASATADELIWKDGTHMRLGPARSDRPFDEMLNNATIRDQFAIPYKLADAPFRPPAKDEDPGRVRNEAFFLKMYGDCRKGEVVPKMRTIAWLPNHGGGSIRATTINGVADQLADASRELDALSAELIPFLVPTSGTYNCRPIAETHRLSMHAFGAAIDLNARFGDYWLWSKRPDGSIVWRNRIPKEIVQIFERHGFIWGGRWHHFDSLHFEYRPELIALAKQGWPRE